MRFFIVCRAQQVLVDSIFAVELNSYQVVIAQCICTIPLSTIGTSLLLVVHLISLLCQKVPIMNLQTRAAYQSIQTNVG